MVITMKTEEKKINAEETKKDEKNVIKTEEKDSAALSDEQTSSVTAGGAMGPNVSGVIGSAVAAGLLFCMLK